MCARIYIFTQTKFYFTKNQWAISAAVVIERQNRGAAKVSDRKDVIRVSPAQIARYIYFFFSPLKASPLSLLPCVNARPFLLTRVYIVFSISILHEYIYIHTSTHHELTRLNIIYILLSHSRSRYRRVFFVASLS